MLGAHLKPPQPLPNHKPTTMDKIIGENAKRLNMSQRKNRQRKPTPTGPPQAMVHMHLNVDIDTGEYPIGVRDAYLSIGPVDNSEDVKRRLADDQHASFDECHQIAKELEQIIINFLKVGIPPTRGYQINCQYGEYLVNQVDISSYPGKIPTITVRVDNAE